MLEQANHNLTDQPLDWCVPKPEPVTQDHHRQTNDLKGSAIKVYMLRDKKGKEKCLTLGCEVVRRKEKKNVSKAVSNLK
jgi:hypothetical protein